VTDSGDLDAVKLVHPRTCSVANFLLDKSKRRYIIFFRSVKCYRLYEVQSVVRGQLSSGSFLVESPGLLVPNQELAIYSEMDPFFLLVDPLLAVAAEEGPFIDYIDCMNGMIEKSESPDMQILIQILNNSPNFRDLFISNFCESRNALDRQLVRTCRKKIFDWLVGKVNTVANYIKESDIYLVEVAGNPDHLSKITALELIRSYISESLFDELVKVIGYNTESVFGDEIAIENEAPKNGHSGPAAKRPNPDKSASSSQPSAKKQKELAVAKTCMKMTSFFKPK
jgi:hypothetical protein